MDSETDSDEPGTSKIRYDHYMPLDECVYEYVVPEEIMKCEAMFPRRSSPYGGMYGCDKLVKILRHKLLQHNWGDAALIMANLSALPVQMRNQLNDIFWKVGNEILYNHPHSDPDLVAQHRQASKTQCFDTDGAHILYEYVLYLITQSDFQSAKEALSFYPTTLKDYNRSKKSHEVLNKWLEDWSGLFEGYLGVLDYISWKKMPADQSPDLDFFESGQGQSPKDAIAEEAVKHFEFTLQSPGVWDIFIGKYIELLESLDRIVEAEDALRTYSLMNTKNPNAHKYWYEFLVKHPELEENKQCRIEALSKLKEVAPAEEYMLDLHAMRMEKAFSYEPSDMEFQSMAIIALEIIMDMLDYNTWVADERSWNILAESLKKVESALDETKFAEVLKRIWEEPMRNTWWHMYHFSVEKAKDALKISSEFAKSKASIAKTLLGPKCEFCKYIKEG